MPHASIPSSRAEAGDHCWGVQAEEIEKEWPRLFSPALPVTLDDPASDARADLIDGKVLPLSEVTAVAWTDEGLRVTVKGGGRLLFERGTWKLKD